ncbi:DUF4163 domain-containing protein [Oceanobacillus luteolus]|uniref:PdaC/SigV domain-containing protein n=1 Tax=Oceanobacillus luteolus TaxID=1274358 RepID=A0ABW4HNE4_9BACI|nr:DUF4163 domain-containing protein [Oceanobacillus luteolus]MCM3740100.1 DUF4163 domain-containing protein [Oceanobacillus luteolus]
MTTKVFLLVTVSFALFTCGKVGATETAEVNNMWINSSPIIENGTKEKYEIIPEKYEDKNVVIEYPQITGISDKEKEDDINQLVKKEAIKPYLETIMQLEPDQHYEADGDYEIKMFNENILSIAYKSYNNITPSAHPFNRFFTTNIDLHTGELLFLPDFVENIDEAFIQKLKNATYIGDLEDKYVDQVKEMAFSSYENDQVLMEALADSEDRKHGIFIYVTEDSLGISLPVPHVAGDHVELEIPLHEIEN